MKNRHRFLVKLCFTAVMAATSILLCRVLGYSPANSMFRVEIGFLPIALTGMLAGPVWAAAGYGAADLLGSLLTTGMNPYILACKVVFGLLLGLCLYRRRGGIVLISVTLFSIGVIVDVALMSGVFVLMGYSPSYLAAVTARAGNFAVNLPIRIGVLYLVCRFCGGVFTRYEKEFHDGIGNPKEKRDDRHDA